MKSLIIGAAVVAAGALFVVGVRSIRARRPPGWRGEFIVALSAALGVIAGACGSAGRQDPPALTAENRAEREFEARVKEVEKQPIWKQMRDLFREMARQMEAKEPGQEDFVERAEKLAGGEFSRQGRDDQEGEAPLLGKDEALSLLASEFLLGVALHMKQGRIALETCYDIAVAPVANAHLPEQKALLKKQLDEGKIKKEVYDRMLQVIEEIAGSDRIGEYRLAHLNGRNTALMFRLIRDMAGKRAIDIPKISPEVEKKIGELIEQLGAYEVEKREEAQRALLEIGEGAIPQLKKALEHEDPEVGSRARAILEELE